MKDSFRPVSRKNDIVVQELKDETLIYDLKSNKAYCLNETSALVWQLCDGKRTVLEISDEMSKRLKSLVSEDFAMIALDQFDKDDLLESNGEKDDRFGGFSRREVIRKVGFATIVALPMVSSIVAPQAAMAQSAGGGALLATCTGSPGQGTCSPTLLCNPTFFHTGNVPGTPTGFKCCSGVNNNRDTGTTICTGLSCAGVGGIGALQCCSGDAVPRATPLAACGPFANSCDCT